MYYKNIFKCFFLCFVFCCFIHNPAQSVLLKGYVEEVPPAFYGTWRVVSKRIDTNSPVTFKEKGLDIWNLSQENNVIYLRNTFSGASAQIMFKEVKGNTVTFTKTGKYDNKILTDKVTLSIKGDNFTGENDLKMETISDIDGSVRKTETARYYIKGDKIAGDSVIGD